MDRNSGMRTLHRTTCPPRRKGKAKTTIAEVVEENELGMQDDYKEISLLGGLHLFAAEEKERCLANPWGLISTNTEYKAWLAPSSS